MKYTIEQIQKGEDELILRYQRLNGEVEAVLQFMNAPAKKLIAVKDDTQAVIDFADILYAETVDRKTFIYTDNDVFRAELTLLQLEEVLNTVNFFRCAKSMIINIDKISALKSLASNRIDAALCSGEHIIISRTYASEFRKILKGESGDEYNQKFS